MASERQSEDAECPPEPLTAPVQNNRTFQWEAILAAVKDQLPSLDSDTSTSDCESDGELFIFQREHPNLIPDLSEELMDFSWEDSNMQQIRETARHPWEIWNEDLESFDLQKETDGVQVIGTKHVQVITDETSSLASHTEEIPGQKETVLEETLADSTDELEEKELGRRQAGETEEFCLNTALSMEEPGNEKERRKLIETKILSKIFLEPSPNHPELKVKPPLEGISGILEQITKEETSSAEHPQELTHLSLQDIEKWDLDKILEELEQQKDNHAHSEEIAFSSADHETLRASSENQLMKKLEELCARQSGTLSPHCKWPSSKLSSSQEQQENKKDVTFLSPSPNSLRMNMMKLQCPPEPLTVYIDLRDAKPQKSVSFSDEKQSGSDSSTEEEETMTTKDQTKGIIENCSGKSLLLQQLRAVRKEASGHLCKTSTTTERLEGIKQDPESLEEIGALKVRRKRYFKVRQETNKVISRELMSLEPENGNLPLSSHGGSKADTERENKTETEVVQHSGNAPDSPLTTTELLRREESKRELSQKEVQMKEKHRRKSFQEQLERLQPQLSVTGKQPMAEKTPVLFHMEASYLPDIDTLPRPDSMRNEMLLMTIWLSSCGQVAADQYSGQVPNVVLTAADIYQALVTWLLSLVPPVKAKGETKAPFQVVGLQQTWQEDGLALYACLMPADESPAQNGTKIWKIKTKEDLQGTSTFYQKISAFLSHTWLPDVIWWRAELANYFQNQPYPLLPEIPSVLLSYITAVNPDPQAVEKVFAVPAGFYWQTVETGEKYFPNSSNIEASRDTDTEVAMVLLFETLFRSPLAIHHMLQLVLSSGLDICGLRLLYPQHDVLLSSSEKLPSSYTPEPGKMPPVLALGMRGPKACSTLQNIMGPSDPQLASVTDCASINALYCRSRAEPLAYLPHLDSRVHMELCLWFGGRAADAALHVGVLNLACRYNKARPQSPSSTRTDAEEEKVHLQGTVLSQPPATLVATTKGDIILLVSPVVSPHAYGNVISVCTHRGFVLQGIRQLLLSPKQAVVLSMTTSQTAVFCPSKISSSADTSSERGELSVEPRMHCLILLLRKENASHHIPALVKALMDELAKQHLLEDGQSNLWATGLESSVFFHVAPYTETLLQTLGGNLSAVPDPCNIPLDILCNRTYASDPEMEQVVMLTLIGTDAMKSAGELLHQILLPGDNKQLQNAGPDSGFELLGLKWFPHLTRSQAREITPFEVGDVSWQRSIDTLMSNPVLVCALRRINAFKVLAETLERLTPCRDKLGKSNSVLQRVMALTPEMTFRQAVLFFTEKDFVTDAEHRPAMKYLPPPGKRSRAEAGETWRCHVESLFTYLQTGAQVLCTVLLIKPGAWTRSLARILRKLDLEKFSVVGMKHTDLEPDVALGLLSSEMKQDPAVLEAHCTYLTSGSALVLCLQRPNAVKKLLDLLGPEDPKLAQALDPFLWRAQYGINTIQNGFYGSKSYQIAVRDMKLFFPEGLCCADCQTLEEEEIYNLKRDPIVGLEINKQRKIIKRKTRGQLNLSGSEQPCDLDLPWLDTLCQTTCLILPGIILRGSEHPPYVELLDQLIGRDFTVTGVRLTVLDAPQAHCISETLSRTKCSVAAKCSLLMDGLCLVLAAQRDNAVVCFDSLLDSVCWQKQSVLDTVQHLLYPQNKKQAEELLCCLFDSLTSDSIHYIESQDC
ncbi:dynein axonemal assembly factor 8 isoform X3 [Apteryx mantelli]|uniref:Dynein axonemal assembly factor 8 n=1 Tax=Apteryx mantelli TaxID=2696672 RepID=A0ABM4FAV0_9AVES